jgi:hypothetical protein
MAMKHDFHVKCECPLSSVHCSSQNRKRARWFEFVAAMDVPSMTKMLEQAGESAKEYLRAKDAQSRSAFDIAVSQQSDASFDFLMKHVQEVLTEPSRQKLLNALDGVEHMTPLMKACRAGDIRMAKALCDAGSAPYITSSENFRAVEYAEKAGHVDVVVLLRSMEKVVDESDDEDIPTSPYVSPGRAQFPNEDAAARASTAGGSTTEANAHEGAEDGANNNIPPRSTVVSPDEHAREGDKDRVRSPPGKASAISRTPSAASASHRRTKSGAHSTANNARHHLIIPQQEVETEEQRRLHAEMLAVEIEERVRFMSAVSFFPVFTALTLKEIARKCRVHKLVDQQCLDRGEDDEPSMLIISSGKLHLDIQRMTLGRKIEKIEVVLHTGQTYGEAMLLTGDKVRANCKAVGPCTVLELDKHSFSEFLKDNWRLIEELSEFLAENVGFVLMDVCTCAYIHVYITCI